MWSWGLGHVVHIPRLLHTIFQTIIQNIPVSISITYIKSANEPMNSVLSSTLVAFCLWFI